MRKSSKELDIEQALLTPEEKTTLELICKGVDATTISKSVIDKFGGYEQLGYALNLAAYIMKVPLCNLHDPNSIGIVDDALCERLNCIDGEIADISSQINTMTKKLNRMREDSQILQFTHQLITEYQKMSNTNTGK